LGCALAVVCSATRARAEDSWWGADKARHFGVSAGLGLAGYGLASLVFEDRLAKIAASAGLALSAGVAKEVYDAMGHGTASWKDLTWDVAGTAVGVSIGVGLDVALSPPKERPRASASLLLHF
jgi:putative lipoprotein